ncbi:MAG: tripartite tricarboxylate transporter permease [Clostridia bacterium]|nr:tripartite tricarboxylate transporter permease [Clostridia bacterium]
MLGQIIAEAFTIHNILIMNLGIALGVIIGAMPGLSLTFAVTIVLTLTYGMDSLSGMYLLLGTYVGGMYGGSITAILINTPGTSNAAATVFDGYPLAQKGRAGDALRAALISSTIGGIFSAFVLMFLAPQVAKIVLMIGSPEYFALCVFGMLAAISTAGKNKLKGLISAMLGLLMSTVGLDQIYGSQRLMFGNYRLMGGLKVSTCMLGAYALTQVLFMAKKVYSEHKSGVAQPVPYVKSTLRIRDLLKYWKTLLRSSVIGTIIGAIPGTGGATSAMFCYNEARRASKHPEEFGQGALEGVVAAECGNNAVTGATLIPMLTLGIPGDSLTAIMLGALTMQGITPGSQLFNGENIWVYAIMGGMLIINLFMLLQGLLFSRGFANISRVPTVIMVPCIIAVCCMGGFAIGNTTFEVSLLIAFGLIGYLMRRFNFPIPPLTIGLVLGSLFETNLRRSLVLSDGSFAIFFTRPGSLIILIVAVLFAFLPEIKQLIAWIRKKSARRAS